MLVYAVVAIGLVWSGRIRSLRAMMDGMGMDGVKHAICEDISAINREDGMGWNYGCLVLFSTDIVW